MKSFDAAGIEIGLLDLSPPEPLGRKGPWTHRILERCFGPGVLCSAQIQLVEPLAEMLSTVDDRTCDEILMSLNDLIEALDRAESGGAMDLRFPPAPFPPPPFERLADFRRELAERFARVSEHLDRARDRFRAPSIVAARLLLAQTAFADNAVREDELRLHTAACDDREHALVLCRLVSVCQWPPNTSAKVLAEAREDLEAWSGYSAAIALVFWAKDEESFGSWDRRLVARLWEEAACWLGALNSVTVLPRRQQIRALQKLLEWGIAAPENPIDLAQQLLQMQFCPDLIILFHEDTFKNNIRHYAFASNPNIPITRALSEEDRTILYTLAASPLVFTQRTNMWQLFGLPDSPDELERLADAAGDHS